MSRVLKTGNTQVTCTYAEHYEKFKKGLSTACGVDVVKHYNQCDWITAHTDGTVIKVVDYLDGTNSILDKEGCAYGNYVMIEHRDRLVTLYAHLEKVQVKEGQKVAKGTVLGFMGNTGGSRGAHLHFEIRGYSKPLSTVYVHDLNAYKYLNAQAYVDIDLPVQTPTPTPAPSGKVIYRVQVGAYEVKANADRQLARVKEAGFTDAFITQVDGMYKIQVGAYEVKANADRMLDRVKAAGFSAFVTKVTI